MTLNPNGAKLSLPQVAVVGAFRFVTFPPDSGRNYPFGIADLLCLSTTQAQPYLSTEIVNNGNGVRFQMDVSDGDVGTQVKVDQVIPTDDKYYEGVVELIKFIDSLRKQKS